MAFLSDLLVGFVAIQHLAFLTLEIFYWEKPLGRRVFGMSKEDAAASRTLAMNQGLYNGFLAAGLIWGLSLGTAGMNTKVFFLACVFIAGIFGGLTASRNILYVQALPALITLIMIFFA